MVSCWISKKFTGIQISARCKRCRVHSINPNPNPKQSTQTNLGYNHDRRPYQTSGAD